MLAVMSLLRFAVATTPELGGDAFDELRAMLAVAAGPDIEPVFVPNYVSLYETVHLHAADAAWSPPLVARDLVRVAAADPIATVLRGGIDHYYSALVAHATSEVRHVSHIENARVGWVSRLSAAGYVVPRDYLQSLGIEVDHLDETFFHTHGRVVQALLDGEVDVVGTFASANGGTFQTSPALAGCRILGVAGQIPGDVIVVARAVDPSVGRELGRALRHGPIDSSGPLAALMNASGFGFVPPDHLGSLARWMERSLQSSFRFVARAWHPPTGSM
jgi:ABC-type phosphate/phosphonate transport system substrate-binding protein